MNARRRRAAVAAALPLLGPHRGACGFCGIPEQRHRLFEAIQEMRAAGDSVGMLADDYDLSDATIEAIAAAPRLTRRDWDSLGAVL